MYLRPYEMGKWVTENWAMVINATVLHDRIQEGEKVRIAYLTNVADTTSYHKLQEDLEKH